MDFLSIPKLSHIQNCCLGEILAVLVVLDYNPLSARPSFHPSGVYLPKHFSPSKNLGWNLSSCSFNKMCYDNLKLQGPIAPYRSMWRGFPQQGRSDTAAVTFSHLLHGGGPGARYAPVGFQKNVNKTWFY